MICCALVAALLAAAPPARDAPLPSSPAPLARAIASEDAAVRRFDESADLHALYLQRALRMLSRHPALAARVVGRLPPRSAALTRNVTVAMRELRRLSAGWPPHRIKVGAPEPLDRLRGFYAAAQRRFGVSRHLLAAVNLVESDFGRLRNESVSGAQGPMQFMPATWAVYGLGGNVRDPRDAVMGAANYLHRSGAPRDNATALHHYNPSPLYVDAVLRYANQMKRDVRAFYGYYAWQVWIRTASGPRRITGPGLRR